MGLPVVWTTLDCEIETIILISYCEMRSRIAKPRPWTLKTRVALAFAGAVVMGWGIVTLLQGKLHYQNYWHAPVFAPFSLFVGALLVIVAIKGRRK
jgi:hypothetical protein